MILEPTPIEDIIQLFPDLYPLRKEDILNLELAPKTREEGDQEIRDCDTYLQLDSHTVAYHLASLSLKQLTKLFEFATNLGDDNTERVTGLKVLIGAGTVADSTTTTLLPLFQPLYLKRIKSEETIGTYEVFPGKYYQFKGSETNTVPEEDVEKYKKTYRVNVIIQEKEFRSGVNTEAVIFPFQTIFTLLYDNEETKEVLLYNAIRRDLDLDRNAKHSILLSSQKMMEASNFKGKYANRSHLCPPDCNTLEYNVAKFIEGAILDWKEDVPQNRT
ncbi:hypothetical protein [Flavobacterium sp.]|uniref:hypothetical protein n=1 Tax=Flavobacterium sp. TaxID=239 RepID=UPI00262DF548|nr:hypothetical protein [Flavobacterium sp.]